MKHVNGDMEDLFRRASEKYPLRTDSADWDRLASALDKDPGPPSDTDKDDKRRRRGIFWWWLLLPLAVAGLGVYGWRATVRHSAHLSKAAMQTQGAGESTGAAQRAGTQGTVAQAGGTEGIVAQGGAKQRTATQGAETQAGGASAAGAGDEAGSAKGPRLAGSTAGRARATATGETRSAGATAAGTHPTGPTARAGSTGGGNVTSDGLFDAADKNMTRKKGGYGNSATGKAGATGEPGVASDAGMAGGVGVMGGVGLTGSAGVAGGAGVARDAKSSRLDLRRVPTAGSYSVVVDVKAPAARKDSSAKQAKKATAKSKGGHGYIGLTGAPDLSTVKMQATKGVGTTWGLLLGYAFNSHWAVESGVYLDRKKYYTAGEYYKGEVSLPAYTSLQSVNGSCNMWEIPLNVRYNFNPGSKITWFATAGASSYFMTKQKYAYEVENGGAAWPGGNWTDSAHDNYLFSIINLSLGFEQRIGRIGNLRIEPYLRIPLSGIGSGRLPIMSAGLNIGITHQLW